jgi:hypothetical protein
VRLAPQHLLLTFLVIAGLAALSTLTPVETERHPAAASTAHTRRTSEPEPWIWEASAADLARIADDLHESMRERQVRVAALGFMRETIMARRPSGAAATPAIRRFRSWARTLPPTTRQGMTYVNLDDDRKGATLTTTWELRTRGYTDPGETPEPHVIGTDVELELELRGGSWIVTDASYEREGLAAFHAPVVVRSGAVTVIADADERELAADIAGIGTRATRGIVANWPGITRSGPVTIYLARSADASELIDHHPAQDHAAAWVTSNADVVMLATETARGDDDAALVDLVWHEFTHVVTAPIDDQLPSMLNEGFADYVGIDAALAIPGIYVNYADQRAAVLGRRYPYARMLSGEHDDEFYDGVVNAEVGYHLGHATIAWIREQRGDATLRRFLRVAGSDGGVIATRRVLRMSPAQLARRAREWVDSNVVIS